MLESLDLADQFHYIATHLRCHHFHGTDIEIRIDQESPPDINPRTFIINAVDRTYTAARIRKQRERNPTFDHL